MEGEQRPTGEENWEREQAERAGFPWFGEPAVSAQDEETIARLVAEGLDPERIRAGLAALRGLEGTQPSADIAASPSRSLDQAGHNRLVASTGERIGEAEQGEQHRPRPSGDIAADTNGELVPRFELVERRADHLRPGDLMLEPRLGEVRITWAVDGGYDNLRHVGRVQLFWTDDAEAGAARSYAVDERLTLRLPSHEDAAAIQRALDRARYQKTRLDDRSARLIAAHLQRGPGSSLYRLAVTGEVSDSALEELDEISRSGRTYLRRWAAALGDYCTTRADWGPLLGLEERQW